MDEVLDIYRMAGDVDYLLKVVVADTKSFDAFYKRLIETLPLKKVTSMRSIRCWPIRQILTRKPTFHR